MTHIAPCLPENAPFSTGERAWINGFLAGLLAPGAFVGAASDLAPLALAEPAPAIVEDFPWHDASLALDERLKLAEGRPRVRRLMAAMAQQDCGQCGYLCQTYAEAIENGEEKGLSRCVPGGKETARALKELLAEAPPSASVAALAAAPIAAAVPGQAAKTTGRFAGAERLSRQGSEKDTRHVVIRFEETAPRYEVGDSLALSVENCPELVAAVIDCLGASPAENVACPDGSLRSLRDALSFGCEIARPSDTAVEVLASRATGPGESDRLQALAEGYPGAAPADADLLELLEAFPSARPPVQELISALGILQPRLYSIASSPKAFANEIHLTVDIVRYEKRGRQRKGVASTFLADRASPGHAIPVAIQPSHNFRLARPEAPIIMIGPGTGVAPFRAFLQERRAIGAKGRNWLFFGAQRRRLDFLYEAELEEFRSDGLLSRLDTAFSRDQPEKIYVQHRMREAAAELWAWLQDGAHLYVCGDAQRMARDVDMALTLLVAKQGRMEWSDAKTYLATLGREGRYQRDVY
jgi:sulfite reductase (NADPH) flavoprotein alpha-component